MVQILLAIAMLLCGLFTAVRTSASAEKEYRLPITVLPSHYTIRLVPYFEERNFTFDGEVDITVNATTDASTITLHYDGMHIIGSPTVLSLSEFQKLDVVNTTYDNITNFFKMELNETIRRGQEYIIHIKYTGYLNDGVVGFYRSSYNTSENETRWMAVTQFEPTHARKAFPCFDEPALKARFQMKIARTQDYHSISNMPRENTSEPDPNVGDRVWDSFEETPPMSTYIVAFVVSDLKNLSVHDGENSVWLREDVLPQGKYALSIAQTLILLLENYTEIMYEIPKYDVMAVPDLYFWAMENWGLVTMMESNILYKENDSKAAKKQDILLLLAHEFSHFWFGNLVTPKWWNYIWLNEGFATYYEYIISAKVQPDWNLEEQFIIDVFQPALYEDSVNSSHSVTCDVHNPEEIDSIFDVISYDKGGSLLRSMEHFLTKETLHKGITKYLNEHSHSSADADDLFQILDNQQKEDKILPVDLDVKTIMDSWTLQSGYPVIHVLRVDRGIHVIQERFLWKRQNDTSDAAWWVPISYTKSTNSDFTDTKPKAWMRGQQQLTLEESMEDTEWIILNIQATGFYRVNYDALTWSLITEHLTSPFYRDIHVLNRAQLLDDAFSLSRAGLLNYTTTLKLSTYLIEETHLIPWKSFDTTISFLNRQLCGTDIYSSFKAYVLTLLNKLYSLLELQYNTEDSHVMKIIQPTITQWACTFGQKDCVMKALEMFSKWTENPENYIMPPDIKKVVYCTAARNGSKMWELLWDQYQHQTHNEDKEDMYEALGCTEDRALLKRYLFSAMSEGTWKYILRTAINNVLHGSPNGVNSVLNFFTENFQEVYKVLDKDSSLDDESSFGNVITLIASHITTQKQAKKLKALLDHNNLSEEAEENSWIPETMIEDIVWAEKHYDIISNWLITFLGEMNQTIE